MKAEGALLSLLVSFRCRPCCPCLPVCFLPAEWGPGAAGANVLREGWQWGASLQSLSFIMFLGLPLLCSQKLGPLQSSGGVGALALLTPHPFNILRAGRVAIRALLLLRCGPPAGPAAGAAEAAGGAGSWWSLQQEAEGEGRVGWGSQRRMHNRPVFQPDSRQLSPPKAGICGHSLRGLSLDDCDLRVAGRGTTAVSACNSR